MTMKTLMIVGGGFGQLPAIKTAKRLGLWTVVVDRNPDAIGMPLADVALAIDVLDTAAVVDAAREHSVSGVMTMQSDIGTCTVGATVDALGLPGNRFAVAERCSNKILTRKALAEQRVDQPRFDVAANISEAEAAAAAIGFPCIVKAPDSSGSRGVTKVAGPGGVRAAFDAAMAVSRMGSVLVEEYIDGHEIGAQAFSLEGRCVLALVHDDILSPPPYMIPVAHAYPATLEAEVLSRVEQAVIKCVDALGIGTGPSNIDIIIDRNGNPKIIEVGARMGATCLPELTEIFTGVDWVEATILASLGECPQIAPRDRQPCAAFILEAARDGILAGYSIPDSFRNNPDIREIEVTARIGDPLSRLTKGTDRIGKVVATGANTQSAVELALACRNAIEFDLR